jgi:hypothetical protein
VLAAGWVAGGEEHLPAVRGGLQPGTPVDRRVVDTAAAARPRFPCMQPPADVLAGAAAMRPGYPSFTPVGAAAQKYGRPLALEQNQGRQAANYVNVR